MRFWARFTKAYKASTNGNTPDPPPDATSSTERRMATDLGDALTAYWQSGGWWGSPAFIRWLINHGHLSEAAYALEKVTQMPNLKKDVRAALRGLERKLDAQLQDRPHTLKT